jgi:hypothetical protein
MDGFSMLFLLGMFAPGLIRGAFWFDSPTIAGVFWTFATIGFVLAVGWVARQIFGSGLGPTIAMVLAVIAANLYTIKGSTFFSSSIGSYDDIDGDANE